MSGELQSLVDDLAERLGRSVVIDDPGVVLVCASRHFGDEDPVRVRTVLQRTAGSAVIAYVLGHSPDRWAGAGMLPGSAELGLLPRLCVPVRVERMLLGYLMVIDADGSLTAQEIETIERCARDAAVQMDAADTERAAADAALLALLGTDPPARASGHERLRLRDAGHAVVAILAVDPAVAVAEHVRAALRGIVTRVVVEKDRAVLLQLRSGRATGEELHALAVRMLDAVGPFLGPDATAVVGVGGQAAGLHDAWVSRAEAEVAVRAARRAPGLGGVGVWDELGELAVLAQLPDDTLSVPAVAGPLRALAAHEGGARLCATLRCFLDHGGSVPRTAAALHLHRTSLYYRLGQIRDITGLDLDDGRNRLLLHLGLRLHDLGFPTER